jgi:hypothetical protein
MLYTGQLLQNEQQELQMRNNLDVNSPLQYLQHGKAMCFLVFLGLIGGETISL